MQTYNIKYIYIISALKFIQISVFYKFEFKILNSRNNSQNSISDKSYIIIPSNNFKTNLNILSFTYYNQTFIDFTFKLI